MGIFEQSDKIKKDHKIQKLDKLKEHLRDLGNVAVAFSSGVDSTFLLKIAHDLLGDKAIAITARSPSFPKRELEETSAFCKKHGITHVICDTNEFSINGFSKNPVNRCYICKKEIFSKIIDVVKKRGISHIIEGSNIDDSTDYRPGMIAIKELGIKSPLCYAKLSKQEIRELSKEMGLSTWNKQSFACLSTRFPYGEEITPSRLSMIEKAEQFLLDMGFHQVRVRYHGNLARIETDANGFLLLDSLSNRKKIHTTFKEIGFTYVALDLLGYRTGSMNETLNMNSLKID
ncbi:MAG: ATP-dependent sacrificial sulfur transferase LarE [Spirochaetaceae bacterium]|nr:ATP-dependent sacrificial sulfur transferase LarE [Spirochaetaceae bacterium]